jgi:diguanylate cyclase (GGDEF)-like protein
LRRWTDKPLVRAVNTTNFYAAAAALAAAAVMLVALQFVLLRNALVDDVSMQASIVGTNSAAALLFEDPKAAQETLHALQHSEYLESAVVFTPRGSPLAVYTNNTAFKPQPPSPELLAEGYHFGLRSVDVAQRIDYNGQRVGAVLIRADLRPMYLRLLGYATLTLVVAVGALIMTVPLLSGMQSAVRHAEARLEFLAHTDPITGLPNRNSFNDSLQRALEEARAGQKLVGLILLDLDDFKVVNDSLGHDQGDLLLKVIAERLQPSMRAGDIICRLGGDEFAAVLTGFHSQAEVHNAGRQMLEQFSRPFAVSGQQIYVTASVGSSISPQGTVDVQTLTRNADTAMYHAKRHGKNACAEFRPEMNQRAQHRLALEHDLHRALERNEFQLYYQPQITLGEGRIVGVEALLRWPHPERGFVSPMEFIPVAEGCGVIVPLGRWVLETACRQMSAWREVGFGSLQMAVNLSVRQMRDKDLLAQILEVLRHSGLPAGQLELEITESMLMENIEHGAALLQALRRHGIRLAIDDFGTGYSSLSYLASYRVDKLKVDRKFIERIPGDGAAITSAIIAMAKTLDLEVAAEGVETDAQLDFLRGAGCHLMQGFHFSPGVPAESLTGMLLAQSSAERQRRAAD